ncbi:DUF2478 domain-containing protein [Methylosinus sp. Sm6]|uniref:DUF2478 domain-containing protein n=1 Tax=Methylosinus sp. Sm6 TaxID=2866948 RepID=UPI001C99A49B|nr:DUF2478 domain-containing protein [Methylosinus sp. Sm6]MBY6240199.1 DUF2478 domain-containing protein [Methylosinus sp. Sm6]
MTDHASPLPVAATRIAALPGEPSADIQSLMAHFARRLGEQGARVAGVTQTRIVDPATGRSRIALRDVGNGALAAISQDLGPGSVACNLDSGELAQACAAIERAAAGGLDLAVISKFSKQEAARGGFADAFRAAIAAKVPVVTAVSPHYLDEWREFAGPLAQFVEPSDAALENWWRRLGAIPSYGTNAPI